jgi:hypothetical protein
MNMISVGSSERDLQNASAGWIREHVEAVRSRGIPVCVKVRLQSGPIDVALATPVCSGSGGGWRTPNREEHEIIELWEKRGLNRNDFDLGQLIAFVNRVKAILRH